MKLKKLLVTSAIIFSLGLTGCQFGPQPASESQQESGGESESGSSEVEPVSRIRLSNVPSTVIVGEEVDLENYVNVEGGPGPKVFEVTVPAVSAENVEVNGHKLTALKEGDFSVTIAAGELTAKFETTAMSALRAELKELLDATTGCYAAQEFEEEDDGSLTLGDLSIHREDYYAGAKAMQHDTGWGPGGMLKATNGKTYEYLMDDMNGTNLQVLPSVQSDFSHWTFAVDIALDVTALTYVEGEEGEDGYFELGVDAIPLPSGWSGVLDNFLDLYGVAIFDISIGTYVSYYQSAGGAYAPITFRKIELANGTETFAVGLNFAIGERVYSITEGYLLVGEDVPEIQAVRDYIDGDNAPAAIEFNEYSTKVNAMAQAKNYTVTIKNGWINRNLEFVDYNTGIEGLTGAYAYSWEDAFPDAIESRVVTADGFNYSFVQTQHYDGTTTLALEEPVVLDAEVGGAVNYNNAVYQFKQVEGGYQTTTVTGATDIWEDLGRYVAAGLVPGEEFAVSDKQELDEGVILFELDQASSSALFPSLVRQSSNGQYIESALDYAFDGDYLDYISTYAIVTASSLTYIWYMRAGSAGYFGQQITFSAIGGGNALSITGADLFPGE